jgi:hypothetical protein
MIITLALNRYGESAGIWQLGQNVEKCLHLLNRIARVHAYKSVELATISFSGQTLRDTIIFCLYW